MSNGEKNMFSGLLVCSDCGRNLHYHVNNRNIRFFNCPGYNQGKRKECFSTHYVRVDFLEQVVLAEIRRLTRFACKYEDNLSGKVSDERFQRMSVNYDNEQKDLRERLTRLNNILNELFGKASSTEKFVEAVRKYTRVKKLTARTVTELIEHIEVHHTEKNRRG